MKQAVPVLKQVIPNPTFSSGIMLNTEIVKFSGLILSHLFSEASPAGLGYGHFRSAGRIRCGFSVNTGYFFCGELLKNLWPSGIEINSYSPKEVLKDYMT